jgi:hypothetical protein
MNGLGKIGTWKDVEFTVTYNSGTTTVDWSRGAFANLTFGAGSITTLDFLPPPTPSFLTLRIQQDTIGGRTIGTWDTDILWFIGGSVITLTAAANSIDVVLLYYMNSKYLAMFGTDFQ